MKKYSSLTNNTYTNINVKEIDEGIFDIFSNIKKNKLVTGIMSCFSDATSSKGSSSKDNSSSQNKMKEQRKKWAQELVEQTENELKNEIRRQEELQMKYEELAHEKEKAERETIEKQKELKHKQEMATVQATINKIKQKKTYLNALSGGPLDDITCKNILGEIDEVAKGIIGPEQELIGNMSDFLRSACYQYNKDTGKLEFVGKDGFLQAIERHKENNPKLYNSIIESDGYKALKDNMDKIQSKEDLDDFFEKTIDEIKPTTQDLKTREKDINELQENITTSRKAIEDNNKQISELQAKRSKLEKAKNLPKVSGMPDSIFKDYNDNSENTPSDDNIKSFANARKEQLYDLALKEKDDKTRKKYIDELKTLTGIDDIKVETDNSGNTSIKPAKDVAKIKEDIKFEDVKPAFEERAKLVKEKENSDKELQEVDKKIQKLDDENQSHKDNIKQQVNTYNNKQPDAKINGEQDITKVITDIDKKQEDINYSVKARENRDQAIIRTIERTKEKENKLDAENTEKKYATKIYQDKDFAQKIKKIQSGQIHELDGKNIYGHSEQIDLEKDDPIVIKDKNGKEVKISQEDFKNDPEKRKEVEKYVLINQSLVDDEVINGYLNAEPKSDSEEDMEEWAKQREIGKALKKAKISARERLKGKEYGMSEDDIDDYEDAWHTEEEDEDYDGDNDDTTGDMDDEEKNEKANNAKNSKNLSDEEKKKQAEEDKEKINNGTLNPAKVFIRRKNKRNGKKSKSFSHIYNREYRLTQKQYNEKIQRYKEKQKKKDESQQERTILRTLYSVILENFDK